MFLQGPHNFVLLGTLLLLHNVLGFCERPAWTRVAWDMTPQDLEQLMTKEQSNYLHTLMCQICHCFTGMGLSKWCLEVLHASCKVAFLIVVGLSINYLLSKLKLAKKTKPCQAMLQTSTVSITTELKDEYTYNRNKMLCRLVTNTSKMMKYMKHVAHHQKKEVKYHKLSKKRKGDDNDEDKELFSICPHNHSSGEDTAMHEIEKAPNKIFSSHGHPFIIILVMTLLTQQGLPPFPRNSCACCRLLQSSCMAGNDTSGSPC